MKKYERMIAWFRVIGMILDIGFKLPATLKKHLATDLMEYPPLLVIGWRAKFMFEFDHWFRMLPTRRNLFTGTCVTHLRKSEKIL